MLILRFIYIELLDINNEHLREVNRALVDRVLGKGPLF